MYCRFQRRMKDLDDDDDNIQLQLYKQNSDVSTLSHRVSSHALMSFQVN